MFAKAIDDWQLRTRGELGDAFPLLEEHAVYKHDDRLHMLVRQCLQILRCRTDEREIEVTSVAQLGSSFFVTKFQDQVTSATVESPEPRYARNALSELNLIRRLSRGVEQQ